MRRVASLWGSTVGKKALMAVSGAVLVLFVIGHMIGNLKVFQGPDHFNEYAEFLREVGTPIVPRTGLLWLIRFVLLAAVSVHIAAAWQLARRSTGARRASYKKQESLVIGYASRTMRWGGIILFLFIVYHLLHLTVGTVHPSFVAGDAYANLVIGFQQPLVVGAYAAALVALGFHLQHGIWSALQTLGANHPRYNRLRRPVAIVVALVVVVGFLSVPAGVVSGALPLR
jgi:succinate dehydrogenase / fumarate reductase cytochrome b subunit